jgi:hypothetical protein
MLACYVGVEERWTMSPRMHFEKVPLEKIKHIIDRANRRDGQNVDLPTGQNYKPRMKASKRKRSVKT